MRKRILAVILCAVMILSMTACGKSNDSSSGGSSTYKDEVHIAYNGEPESFDPVHGTAIATRTITKNIYEGLLETDADYNVKCQLAEKYETNEDASEYTFYLRKGVKFHNGKEMTADDVVASLNYYIDFKPTVSYFATGSKFEKVDDYTVKIKFDKPSAMFPYYMVNQTGFAAIMPKEVIDSASDAGVTEFIGTGPYKYDSYVSGEYFKLIKYDDYVGPGYECNGGDAGDRIATTKTLYFDFVNDPMTRLAGVNTGEYDIATGISYDNIAEVDAYGLTKYADWSMNGCLFMNQSHGVFMDENLRKAVRLAMDPEEMMAAAIPDKQFYDITGSFAGRNMPSWYDEDAEQYIGIKDIDTAKKLVEDSDYDGSPIKLIATTAYPDMVAMAMVLQQELKEIGLNIEVETYDWATTLQKLWNMEPVNENYDIYIMCYPYEAAPTASSILTMIYSIAYADLGLISEPMEKMEATTDPDERYGYWKEIQKILYDNEMVVKFYDEATVTISTKKVESLSNFGGPLGWSIKVAE